ncbi:hypothetical protein [Corallococcus silvisoli]|uniref:hypothetical protein n=1 Tax=Corallococcus silvisoli TaxID=2697031 RepID=UPI001376BBB5|nr:hypothetical protein [Corallococcus silvisoli]NBD12262.1 hypothetical protein [Corallococcus silvisoli]
MSDFPRKPDPASPPIPSEPAMAGRRRAGRALLTASAVGMTLAAAGCGSLMTTNPAPCNYDDGFQDGCEGTGQPDAGVDGGTDAGSILVP